MARTLGNGDVGDRWLANDLGVSAMGRRLHYLLGHGAG